uniref:G-protein coupled receptors family 1 profile domain-containing protein n=1 Tax=Petromyzon marinus TaxID=7757 RepID=S4RID5_PETMA
HLRKPMNIFLCNLMVADVIACASSVPRQLHILLTGDGRVAYTSCVVQMFWVHFFVHSEVLTLAAVVATLTTNVAVVAAVSVATALVVPLKFARDDQQIQGIYCDSMGISRLSISDTRINDLYGLALTAVFIGVPLCAIGITYFKIILELKRSSGDFRKKSASTLTTHFLVLAVVFTSLFVTILLPRLVKDFHGPQVRNARCASQFAIFIIPIANVTIYVFRTRELREAMLRCFKQSLPKAH